MLTGIRRLGISHSPSPQRAGAPFPNQTGKWVQNLTERSVLHDFVGIHLLCEVGEWPQVLNLTEEHGNLLTLLGQPYRQFYDVKYS